MFAKSGNKNSFSLVNFITPKKYFWAVFVFLSSVFVFLPNRNFAQANIFDDIKNGILDLPTNLAMAIIGTVFWVVALITNFLSGIALNFLNWILSPSFMPYSYTNPNNNEVIKTGLSVTQSLVNMLLVVVLVYIALATILRLAGYETRKALITFVIIALLVNFSPVVCGLIVDASNITMKFFLNPSSQESTSIAKDITSTNIKAGIDETVKEMWTNILQGLEGREAVMKSLFIFIISIIVSVMSFFIYIIFAFVFIVRYFAIWILVILSPIAFACYVLPATRKFWNMWWEQFVQWCIVGVTCAFFLYLANFFYQSSFAKIATSKPDKVESSILPLIIPIIFLVIGLIYGLQTSAIGASAVMRVTQRGMKAAGGGATRRVARGAGRVLQDKLKTRELASWASAKVEGVPMARWFMPEAVRKYGQSRRGVEKAQAELKDYSSRDLMRRMASGDLFGERAMGAISEVISRGDSQDIVNAYKNKLFGKKASKKSDEDVLMDPRFQKAMIRPLTIAQQSGMLGSGFLRKDPRMARLKALMGESVPDTKEGMEQAMQEQVSEIVKEVKQGNVSSWEKEVLDDKLVVHELMGRERNIWEAVARDVKKGRETAQGTIDKNFTGWVDQKGGIDKFASQKKAWDEYEKDLRSQGKSGYFEALKDKKFRSYDWREGKYQKPEEIDELTPGEASTGDEEKPKPKKTPPDTGESREKKPKTPDTGKA